jgi:hypothetical protein
MPLFSTVRRLLFLFFLAMGHLHVAAQDEPDILELPVTGTYRDVTLIEILIDLEQRYQLKIYYDPNLLPYYPVSYDFAQKPLLAAMRQMFDARGFVSFKYREKSLILCRNFENNREYALKLVKHWETGDVQLPDFLLPFEQSVQVGSGSGSGVVEWRGQVRDDQTREGIAGVKMRLPGVAQPVVTDALGRFVVRLPVGMHEVRCQVLGYREGIVQVRLSSVGEADVLMRARPQMLQEVVIEGLAEANKIESVNIGVEVLKTKQIKELPAFMGEADVLKALSVLPGVSSVGEGASGFNVRGGNADQNLVLQDGIPFFNASHVLGFFSVFNPDLVRSTTLYKGNIPAEYGGRLSSVLDVDMRDGNYREWHGGGGVGLAAARASVEGPIWRERASVVAGFRTSYSEWMLRRAKLPDVQSSSANFNDLNVRLSARTNANGSVSATWHQSSDYFRYAQQFGYQWNTKAASMTWRQVWASSISTQMTASGGRYGSAYFVPEGGDLPFRLNNGLWFGTAKLHVAHIDLAGHQPNAGIQYNLTDAIDERLRPVGESVVRSRGAVKDRGAEWAAYVGDTWAATPWLSVYAGLRYSFFQALGAKTVYEYAEGVPLRDQNIVDSTVYAPGKTYQTYGGLEPRISINFRIDARNSLKISYNRMRQYLHQISNTTAPTPTDVWQVSNAYIPPQVGDNFSAGWFVQTESRVWDHAFEVFYKTVDALPAYRDFADLLVNPNVETELITGRGRSYGAEMAIRKDKGWLTGLLAYTWSRSWQQASSPYVGQSVNGGAWFPANFDQPHQLNLSVKMTVSPVSFFNFNFVYRNGRPVTVPTAGFAIGSATVPYFPLRNNFRLSDYHRLDVGYTFDLSRYRISGPKYTFNISVYNLYARDNAFSIFFKRDKFSVSRAYELSVIGAAIPAATLSVTF